MELHRRSLGWRSVSGRKCGETAGPLQDSKLPSPVTVGPADSVNQSGIGMGFRTRKSWGSISSRTLSSYYTFAKSPNPPQPRWTICKVWTAVLIWRVKKRTWNTTWYSPWPVTGDTSLIICTLSSLWLVLIIKFSHVRSAGLHTGVCSFDALIYMLPGIQRPTFYMRTARIELS